MPGHIGLGIMGAVFQFDRQVHSELFKICRVPVDADGISDHYGLVGLNSAG